MATRKATFLALVPILLLGAHIPRAEAIITRVNPQDAIISLSDAKFFVSVGGRGNCAGSIMSDSFVVTAAHCVCGTQSSGLSVIDYQEQSFAAVASYINPDRLFDCEADGPNGNDVAVLEFSGQPFQTHDARSVYSASDEVGKTIWIMGMGIKGQPDDFCNANACSNGSADTSLREGFNTVNTVTDGVLRYDMTSPSEQNSLEKEAIAQDGDSGGPALIDGMVAGVNSGTDDCNPCDYGSVDMYCRLSEHAAWISRAVDTSLDGTTRGLQYTFGSRSGDDNNNGSLRKGKNNVFSFLMRFWQ